MNRRLMRCLIVLVVFSVLLLGLSACGTAATVGMESQTQPAPSISTEPPASESASESVSQAETEPAAEPGPLRELACLAEAAPVTAAASGGPGRALVCCMDYREEGERQTALLLDIRGDRILASREMAEGFWLPLGCRKNGELLLASPEQGLLLRCDEALQPLETLSFPGDRVVFSPDADCIFAFTPQCMTRLELSGETQTLLQVHNGAVIEEVDPSTQRILISGLPANEQEADVLYGIYNFAGELLWTQETKAIAVSFAGGLLLAQDYDAPLDGTGGMVLAAYDDRDGTALGAYVCDRNERILGAEGSAWLCDLLVPNEDGAASQAPARLSLLSISGERRIPVCELEGSADLRFVPTGEGDGILVCATTGGRNRLLVVEPELLTASDGLQPVSYDPEPDPLPAPEYPAHLAEVRALADRIEQDYGVTILFGDAVLGLVGGDYPYVTPSGAYEEHESFMLQKALECLDRTLASYPEGFTDCFLNFKGEGGLRFFLATEFLSEAEPSEPTFVPSGETYTSGGWYNINLVLVDCTETLIHHEIWHAVENYLGGAGSPVDEAVWFGMNPEGFAYGNDFNSYLTDERAAAFTLDAAEPADSCIIRNYSSVNEAEDRATLIEYVLRPNAPRSAAENFTDRPILQAKLDYLTELVRSAYGYVYWEEILKRR